MLLSLINPDDLSVEEFPIEGLSEETGANVPVQVWSARLNKYTEAGRDFDGFSNGPVTDIIGWGAVVSEDGEVLAAGDVNDVRAPSQMFHVDIIEVPAPMPDFFNP